MGNFSRNTFDPAKNYVSVRLQQGVPLVDADWNEQADVQRQELHTGLTNLAQDGVTYKDQNYTNYAFTLNSTGVESPNNFRVSYGSAIVGGRAIYSPGYLTYSEQRWTDPAVAQREGVAVIPPLTTPTAPRKDLVYLDVWEREIGKGEDGSIVNPAIGVETSVRLKREFAVRVVEGSLNLPSPPIGHGFLQLAYLDRPAGDPTLPDSRFLDARKLVDTTPRNRWMCLTPTFQPVPPAAPWTVASSTTWPATPKVFAFKAAATASAAGFVPVQLPHDARVQGIEIEGQTRGTKSTFSFGFSRVGTSFSTTFPPTQIAGDTIDTIGPFDRLIMVAPQPGNHQAINMHGSHYLFHAYASGSVEVEIHGLSVYYSF